MAILALLDDLQRVRVSQEKMSWFEAYAALVSSRGPTNILENPVVRIADLTTQQIERLLRYNGRFASTSNSFLKIAGPIVTSCVRNGLSGLNARSHLVAFTVLQGLCNSGATRRLPREIAAVRLSLIFIGHHTQTFFRVFKPF